MKLIGSALSAGRATDKSVRFKPVQRFKGEFFILGLALAVLVMVVMGPMAAFVVTGVVGLVQVMLLRRERLSAEQANDQLQTVQAQSAQWETKANAFMNELASFKSQVSYQDAETGLGNVHQFETDFAKEVARNQRREESFSVVLLQVRDQESPDVEIDTQAIVAAAERLAESTRVEDTLCRVAKRGFAIILESCDEAGASAYMERCRRRFDEVPVISNGQELILTLSGGVAQYDEAMTDFQAILRAAAQNLHARSRMRTQATRRSA